ncbi:TetR/AcrR family transcriptional regulator [Aquabacterium sp.]|uniref:TetR/AcrR family transcriptional regulator n=1 Tax=Aquabacterium sp. TaxID=1872578 RepID=UPI002CFC34D2|nr:TetR/AcrR family transcriptional regulator [Aquabacterium sp.]HSW06773.1 TetR/AcrR family transcriptional regulator [Aquabacterium sp.]
MKTPGSATRPTAERFLAAAESVFIRCGYEGAAIRLIAAEAGAHLSAFHHYWGSKEALFRQVCERRFGPVQLRQLERLHECEAALAAGLALDVRTLVLALIEPAILAGGGAAERETTRLFYGRALLEPAPAFMQIMRRVVYDTSALFNALMRHACPALDAETFYWRFNCALGAIIVSHSYGERVAQFFDQRRRQPDWARVIDEIAGFVAAGMQRPA